MLRARRSSLRAATAVVAATLLAGTVLALPSYAVSDAVQKVDHGQRVDEDAPQSRADDTRADQAVEALEVAEESLQGDGEVDPTLALLDVQQSLDDLPVDEIDRATRLLARPTEPGQPGWAIQYRSKAFSHCTAHYCVHWVKGNVHKPDLTDSDDDEVPDYVETVASVMEHVWSTEVGTMNYQRPRSDGTEGNPIGQGRSGLVDVYIGDTGATGVYGYAATEANTRKAAAYLVLDNDYTDFPGVPVDLLKVTAAHEFFHAVQFGYAADEDGWLMETTATWMEERVYDAINDNRQYIPASSLRRPGQPLDLAQHWYGNWVFFELLSARYGNSIVRAVWNRAESPSVNAMQAINNSLGARGSNLQTFFARFAADNAMARRAYPEGASAVYRSAPYTRLWKLGTGARNTGPQSARLAHMSSRNYVFVPRAGTPRSWRLRFDVTAPSYRARAYVVVHLRDGSVVRRPVTPNSRGTAVQRVRFGSAEVTKVTLSLVNASFRYRCNTGGQFTCTGTALDDGRTLSFRATLQPA